ncbi:MAG: helix-turn-helix domain-containing protein, partial [Propionibacteriaceae bacterium]|nr:helix-turn-helix domain-containing protein [Propionibacteriaceae bacterium]
DAARARGRRGARPPGVNAARRRAIAGMLADGRPVAAAARAVGVSRATVYRHLARERGRA